MRKIVIALAAASIGFAAPAFAQELTDAEMQKLLELIEQEERQAEADERQARKQASKCAYDPTRIRC